MALEVTPLNAFQNMVDGYIAVQHFMNFESTTNIYKKLIMSMSAIAKLQRREIVIDY